MANSINLNLTDAIRAGVLTFEQAQELVALAGVGVVDTLAPKQETPKARKPKAPKQEAPKPETAEETPKEPLYSKGGAIIQYPDDNTLTPTQKAAVTREMNKLNKQGFTVTWKRCGDWVSVYQCGETRDNNGFKKAKSCKGWTFHKGAWVNKELCKGNADSFKQA